MFWVAGFRKCEFGVGFFEFGTQLGGFGGFVGRGEARGMQTKRGQAVLSSSGGRGIRTELVP